MKPNITVNFARKIFTLLCGAIITLIIILIMNKDYPFVGHDYRYFIPHLIDTNLHIRLNGPSIQWYSPSFGGGLPAFPNPQHIEYSIVQWLSIIFAPWSAVLLSTAVISLVGYYFIYKFLNEKLELDWMSSTLGAMFFIGNGFYIEHLIAGHLGYQLFPLGAVILYALTDQRNKCLYNATIVAAMVALMIHQAGFYIIFIVILSLGMTLPILFLYKPLVINLRRIILTTIIALTLAAAMAASKVYAIWALMHHFPRVVFDTYNVGLFQATVGIIAQLFGVLTLEPFLMVTGHNPDFLYAALSRIVGTPYGLRETDTGLSPVLIFFLLIGLAQAISRIHRNARPTLNRSILFRFMLIALPIWITMEWILARGMIYTLLKPLPILRSLHVNFRATSAFILPLIILGAIQLHRYFLKNSKPVYFYVSVLLTSISLFSYFSLSSSIQESDFSVSASNVLHQQIRNGMTFPVSDIVDTPMTDWQGFSEHSSLYKPWEPIFGYGLESYTPEIHPGEILETSDGYFNMTNPASFVFPEINDLYPFERIKVSEREKLKTFLERGEPEWNIPIMQKILNKLSLITLLFSVGVLFTIKLAEMVSTARQKKVILTEV